MFLWLTILQFHRLLELLLLEELMIDFIIVCFSGSPLLFVLCYYINSPDHSASDMAVGPSDYLSVYAKGDKNAFV